MCRSDSAIAINQKSGRKRLDASVRFRRLVITHQDTVIDGHFLDEWLYFRPSAVIHRHTYYRESAILILAF
jgi:hypothetical protein